MKKLLIINSQPTECHFIRSALADCCTINSCTGPDQAITLLKSDQYDYIILDLPEPSTPKIRLALNSVRQNSALSSVICCGPADNPELIVEAIKHGACYFLAKPLCTHGLQRALLQAGSQHHAVDDQAETKLYGDSQIMRELRHTISLYAKHKDTVLIVGESGTGKDLVAQAIHRRSGREGAFKALDCASIPENLAESILFGAERGAYTDCVQRKGIFEEAAAGTIFLDELAELPRTVQAKLLRTLETRQGTRLGSNKTIQYDVRVVSATNAKHLTNDRLFRADLLSRLETLIIETPPLRLHIEDIPQLARHFMHTLEANHFLTENALDKLCSWHWPGNIRELKNVLTRACILAEGKDCIDSQEILTGSLSRWASAEPGI